MTCPFPYRWIGGPCHEKTTDHPAVESPSLPGIITSGNMFPVLKENTASPQAV